MQIGVLALQGAFIEHEQMLAKLGVSSFEIRCLDDLKKPFDGLIIPGGESTVIGKLLFELGLLSRLKSCSMTDCRLLALAQAYCFWPTA